MRQPEHKGTSAQTRPILVTEGAGFIGSNSVLDRMGQVRSPIVNLDALTRAGNLAHLAMLDNDARHVFVHGRVEDSALIARLPDVDCPCTCGVFWPRLCTDAYA